MTNRLDVRLDSEHRSRLEELARDKGLPISDIVRGLIDDAYEQIDRERRHRAFEQLVALEIDVPEDPRELSRILSQAHDPGPLY